MTGWLPLRCPLTAFESAAVICWPRPGPSPAAARPCSQRTGSGCLFFLLFSFSRGERKTHKTLAALRQAKTVCSGSGIRLDGQYYLIMCVRITPSPPPPSTTLPLFSPLFIWLHHRLNGDVISFGSHHSALSALVMIMVIPPPFVFSFLFIPSKRTRPPPHPPGASNTSRKIPHTAGDCTGARVLARYLTTCSNMLLACSDRMQPRSLCSLTQQTCRGGLGGVV